jgi:hypothetical protein
MNLRIPTGYIIYLIRHHKVKQKWNNTKNVKPYTYILFSTEMQSIHQSINLRFMKKFIFQLIYIQL